MSKKSSDKEYKIEVVKQVKEFGRSAPDIARELGIHVNTLYKWLLNTILAAVMLSQEAVNYSLRMKKLDA